MKKEKLLEERNFAMLVGEAMKCNDVDEFVSDFALSDIWNDSEDDDVPTERIEFLRNLWEVAHMTVKDILNKTGLSQRRFSERFFIPYRTVQNWCLNKRTPPAYLILMFAECLGLYKYPSDD